MDLRSPNPYWLLKNGLLHSYPSLSNDIYADVAVMGCGISGALTAYRLVKAGFNVVMVDKRNAAMGSTAASTSLLQYEIDVPLHKLAIKIGLQPAVTSYKLCLEAISGIERLTAEINGANGFERKKSLQFSSFKKHVPELEEEYLLRKKHNISKLDWLTTQDMQDKYGFKAPAAILSADGAQVDAYRFTHELLQACKRMGTSIYNNTAVTEIIHCKKGITLITQDTCKINCRHLVIACGYESQRYISKRIENAVATYAIASEPLNKREFWHKNSLIWETAIPYTYIRTTPDNRILIGGKDDKLYDPRKRDHAIVKKAALLENTFKRMFPHIPFKTDFAWGGTFCSTKDGLPYIGTIAEHPDTYFALGFGGNGITFSYIAADIITDLLKKGRNKHLDLFSFTR